jgi:hypothetical protein
MRPLSIIQRTDEEVADLLDQAKDRANKSTEYGAMSYEEGIQEALLWLTDPNMENPL